MEQLILQKTILPNYYNGLIYLNNGRGELKVESVLEVCKLIDEIEIFKSRFSNIEIQYIEFYKKLYEISISKKFFVTDIPKTYENLINFFVFSSGETKDKWDKLWEQENSNYFLFLEIEHFTSHFVNFEENEDKQYERNASEKILLKLFKEEKNNNNNNNWLIRNSSKNRDRNSKKKYYSISKCNKNGKVSHIIFSYEPGYGWSYTNNNKNYIHTSPCFIGLMEMISIEYNLEMNNQINNKINKEKNNETNIIF